MARDFSTVQAAVDAIARGEVVIVVDDEDRENEGDFICAAEKATGPTINFMVSGRGQLCAPVLPEVCPEPFEVPAGVRYHQSFHLAPHDLEAQRNLETVGVGVVRCPAGPAEKAERPPDPVGSGGQRPEIGRGRFAGDVAVDGLVVEKDAAGFSANRRNG